MVTIWISQMARRPKGSEIDEIKKLVVVVFFLLL